jgi:hypothetical protein
MPTSADEFQPTPELLAAVIDECLVPRLKRIEDELHRPLAGEVEAWTTGCFTGLRREPGTGSVEALRFDGRVRFRKTSDPARILFMSQVRIFGAEHGFTGFRVRGQVKAGSTELKSYTGLYNHTEWLEW